MKKAFVLLGLAMVAVFCMAAQTAPAPEGTVVVAAASGIHWMDIVKGLVAGAIAAAIGYFKSQDLQKLEILKLAKTVIFGGVIGGVAAWRGTSLPETEKWAAMVGLSFALTYVWDIIVRRAAQPVVAKVIARRALRAATGK